MLAEVSIMCQYCIECNKQIKCYAQLTFDNKKESERNSFELKGYCLASTNYYICFKCESIILERYMKEWRDKNGIDG